MDPFSISASVAGLLSLTITIASGLDSIVSAYRGTSQDVFELVLELSCLRQCLENIGQSILGLANVEIPCEPEFLPLLRCMATLLELQKLVPDGQERIVLKKNPSSSIEKLPMSVWEKIKWIRHKPKIQEHLSRLQSHKIALMLFVSEKQFKLLRDGLEKYELLIEAQDKKAARRFDHWKRDEKSVRMCSFFTSPKSAPHDRLRKAEEIRHADTGLWFVQGHSFLSWSSSEESKLWVHGIPGAGKTILASLAITTERRKTVRNGNTGVVYFFCDYKTPETLEINAVLGSLLFQLSIQNTGSMESQLDFYDKTSKQYSSVHDIPPGDLCQEFNRAAQCFDGVSLVVDGLDECRNQEEVTRYLAGLSSAGSRVKCLFFSRDTENIEKLLVGKHSFAVQSVAADNGDIKKYVDAEVEKRTEEGELQADNELLRTKIREKLIEGSKGMFRWVECQLDTLSTKGCCEDVEAALEDLPEGLDETYDRILGQIKHEKEVVSRALKWICLHPEPLTLTALAEIANQKIGATKRRSSYDTKKLLKYCGSLVRKPDYRNIVELAHYSVKEYLLRLEETSEYHIFRVDINMDQVLLGTYCLGYLLLQDYEIGPRTSREEHQKLRKSRPFRDVAIQTWRDHAVDKDGNFLSTLLLKLAQSLFCAKRPMWFETFVFESYLWEESLSRLTDSTLSQVAEKVRTSLPIHWAAFFRLPELIKEIVKQDPTSVHVSSKFGTPLHCVLTHPSTGEERIYITEYSLYNSVQALISAHIDVNQSFKVENREVCSRVLPRLNRPLGVLLLGAGLYCDRESLQTLHEAAAPKDGENKDSTKVVFDDVQEKNVMVCDQQSWISMAQKRKKIMLENETGNHSIPTLEQYSGNHDEILVFCAKYRKTSDALAFIHKKAVDINGTDCDGLTALHHACANNDQELVETLLKFGADIDIRDGEGWTATHHLARNCRMEILDLLLSTRNQSLASDNIGRTPLHIAAASGNQSFFRPFWDQPSLVDNLSPRDHDGLTPFLVAAREGQTPLVLELFKNLPAEATKSKTPLGLSALHLACRVGSESVVDFLLEKGFDSNSTTNDNVTVLHLATATPSDGQLGIVNSLLDFGASLLTRDNNGDYPIHRLVMDHRYRYEEKLGLLQRMLDNSVGCENVGNELGNTPLHNACFSGQATNIGILKLYLDHGSDLFKENHEGKSSFQILLHNFIRAGGPSNKGHFIEFFLECAWKRFSGPPPRSAQAIIKALNISIGRKYWEICRSLLKFIKDLRKEYAPDDPEPIHIAAGCHCDFDIFQIIVQRTTDLTTYDSYGMTPLHLAASVPNLQQVQAIVEKSPRTINQRSLNRDRETPLLSTSISSFLGQQIVQYLVSQGADTNLKDTYGLSIFHYASLWGYINILQTFSIRQVQRAGNGNYTHNGTIWWSIGCIHCASFGVDTNVMEYLLDAGFDVDEPSTKDLMTPLHISASTGNHKMTKFLLKRKATIDKPNAAGETPLTLAFRSQNPEIVQLMIDSGGIIALDADSITSFEAMLYGKPEQTTIFKNALKSRGRHIQGVSLKDILSRTDPVNISADDEKKLRLALKLAIETGNEQLCDEITSKNYYFSEPIDDCGHCSPLIYALRLRMTKVAHLLVRTGIGINDITCNIHQTAGFDTLHYAAKEGDQQLIRLLFNHGYTSTKHPVHALHIAAAESHLSCLEAILECCNEYEVMGTQQCLLSGSNSIAQVRSTQTLIKDEAVEPKTSLAIIDIQVECIPTKWPWDYCGYQKMCGPHRLWTPLHIAVRNDSILMIDFLLSRGADPNIADAKGFTPLHLAAQHGFVDSISKLLDSGADPLLVTKSSNWTPLFCALDEWNIKAVELLLTPQSVNCVTQGGRTVLHEAVSLSNEELIIKVLSLDLDINIADDEGWISYHEACDLEMEDDALRMASFVHSHGADINACTKDGQQPISLAIQKGHLKLCQQLVANGAVLFNTKGVLHLGFAIEFGHVELTKWLILHYPDLQRVEDSIGCRPFHYGMHSNSPEMHVYVLHNCNDLNFDCVDCGSLLNLACKYRRHYIIKKIADRLGPDNFKRMNQKSSKSYSPPLITAIIYRSLECVEALLDANADIEIKTDHWDTPLLTACKYGRDEIVRLLIKRGAKLYQTNKDGNLVSAVEAAKNHKPLRTWLEQNVPESGMKLLEWSENRA